MRPDEILQQPRPWTAPLRPWALQMNWHDLLFAHWPVAAESLKSAVPRALELDTFEGNAWIGVVPFGMRRVRPRFLPELPWISAFPELNVRTYVKRDGRPGVWFFSLDAGNPLVVRTARAAFHLPYFDARMSINLEGERVSYSSRRTHSGQVPAAFEAVFWPSGGISHAAPDSIDDWLTGRYCLYAADRRGTLYRGEIHHAPWALRPAEAEISSNSMSEALGISLPATEPLLHFSRSLDVVAWSLDRIG